MNIALNRNRSAAGALVMVFVFVSCAVVVGLGLAAGCKTKKAIERKQHRDRITESNLLHEARLDYRREGVTRVAADMVMSRGFTVPEDRVDEIKVQWSTNLIDWRDGDGPTDAPAMFFRIVGPK